ncbi:MAG: type II secretion system protein GspK, partial [Gemmata sp.]
IRAVALTDGGGYEQRYGAIDEGGKLNINSLIALDPTGEVLYNALLKVPNMTPEIADAIVDWVDADDTKRASGAESAEYQSLPNPYKAKNGPLNSLDELLLVQGVTPDLLYGGDRNRNGVFDDGEASTDRGWSDYLTVYGRELNVDMAGTVRTYLNGDNLTTLQQQLTQQVGDELTTYILAAKLYTVTATDASGNLPSTTAAIVTSGGGGSMTITISGAQPKAKPVRAATADELRAAVQAKMATTFTGGKRIRSVADLLYSRITLPRPAGAKAEDPDVVAFSPMLANPALFATLLDRTTVKQAVELVPRINVNSAPREVLMAVPNMTDELADAIIAARPGLAPTDPATVSGAWLITAAGVTPATYKKMEKYITGTSMVYRVQSVGYLAEGGPVARMEAVIDTNQGAPRFLHVRDLSELDSPRGFEPMRSANP